MDHETQGDGGVNHVDQPEIQGESRVAVATPGVEVESERNGDAHRGEGILRSELPVPGIPAAQGPGGEVGQEISEHPERGADQRHDAQPPGGVPQQFRRETRLARPTPDGVDGSGGATSRVSATHHSVLGTQYCGTPQGFGVRVKFTLPLAAARSSRMVQLPGVPTLVSASRSSSSSVESTWTPAPSVMITIP